MSTDKTELKLIYLNGSCFVWSASDARYLREQLRVVGTLVGCLPRAPRQNSHLGLPLQLMSEEVTLLLEKGHVRVVEEEFEDPTDEVLQTFRDRQQHSYHKQIELFQTERRNEVKRRMPEILEGKKAKRNKILEQKRQKGEQISDSEFEAEIKMDPDELEIPPISEHQMLVQTYLACHDRKKHCREVDWKYPQTDKQKLRYNVFKDLWEKGHYITSGIKFGGDFLAYPGDPCRFHSLFVVICRLHNEPMSALEIITIGRLGTNVKKTVLLCSEDTDGQICYTSLNWTGIS